MSKCPNVTCDYQAGYLQSVAKYNFIEDCHIIGGLRKDLLLDNHGIFARSFCHIENNNVEHVGNFNMNDGETYCVEQPWGNYNCGVVLNAKANNVTVNPMNGNLQEHYDAYNEHRENVEITFGFHASRAYLCSMMEEDLQELSLCERSVHLTVKPFEIVTLKVYPNDKGEAQ